MAVEVGVEVSGEHWPILGLYEESCANRALPWARGCARWSLLVVVVLILQITNELDINTAHLALSETVGLRPTPLSPIRQESGQSGPLPRT